MSEKKFKLPKYLRLARGAMWFDVEGEDSSGVKLYSFNRISVGRGKDGELVRHTKDVDKHNYEEKEDLDWYFDTTKIDKDKQSRIILAFQHGILVKADPKNPPTPKEPEQKKDFKIDQTGETVFIGKNKEIYKKLQNMDIFALRDFIKNSPKTSSAKNNLIDMYHYEQKGYNAQYEPRGQVIDLIREKLNEYGPSMSPIRVNEDDDD